MTSFSEPAHRVIWAQALQTCGSQKSLPPLVEPPPVSPALLGALKCLPPRSGCRLSSRGRHKGLLVGLQPGEGGGSAEPPGDSRPCHFLCAPRSSAWLRAGARLWRWRCGRPGKPPRAFMWAGGSRHARPAHAHSLPEARGIWIRCGGDMLAAWLLQGSKQSTRPWGGMWSPTGAAPRLVSSEGASLWKSEN